MDRGPYPNRGGEINGPTKIFYFNAYFFFHYFAMWTPNNLLNKKDIGTKTKHIFSKHPNPFKTNYNPRPKSIMNKYCNVQTCRLLILFIF